jgi:hypothetical protein
MGPAPGNYSSLYDHVIKGVEAIYKRTRTRAMQSVKKGNSEIVKYVEQLGRASNTQQQTTPTPNPTEKTNGAEEPGEEAVTTTKPN